FSNVYTRAAQHFQQWRSEGILRQDARPSLYHYTQRFEFPGSGTVAERRGFIALGRVEDYAAGVVFRHEQTLSKPKADRLNLLRATRAHFGQIFMLYSDSGEIDSLLTSSAAPDLEVTDEYGVVHRMWKVSDAGVIDLVREKMVDKKLIIADGHHRYETALTYRNEKRDPASSRVMMTFVNMNSGGLVILATHRVVHSLPSFSVNDFLAKARQYFAVEELAENLDAQRASSILRDAGSKGTALVAVTSDRAFLLTKPRADSSLFAGFSARQQALDVVQLHKVLLETVLGLSEESIRNQENLSYVRDASEAIARVRKQGANVAFLMNPARMEQVRDIAFAGEVLPQKSTDFYPKMLTGLTIYALD